VYKGKKKSWNVVPSSTDGLNFRFKKGGPLDHRPPSIKVRKPWGGFVQYTHNLPCTIKIITVAPGGALSRQYHHHRDELWVVLDAGARVELGDEVLDPEAGEELFIRRQTVHRLSAVGENPVRILEISYGEFDEEDIIRLEDAYGRAVQ